MHFAKRQTSYYSFLAKYVLPYLTIYNNLLPPAFIIIRQIYAVPKPNYNPRQKDYTTHVNKDDGNLNPSQS
jgi:hypothetical protein